MWQEKAWEVTGLPVSCRVSAGGQHDADSWTLIPVYSCRPLEPYGPSPACHLLTPISSSPGFPSWLHSAYTETWLPGMSW